MSIRLTCPSCLAAFLTADDRLGQSVECPKCGAEQVVPATVLASPSEASRGPGRGPSGWPATTSRTTTSGRDVACSVPIVLVLLPLVVLSVLVAWPRIRGLGRPEAPRTPRTRSNRWPRPIWRRWSRAIRRS